MPQKYFSKLAIDSLIDRLERRQRVPKADIQQALYDLPLVVKDEYERKRLTILLNSKM